MKYLIITIFYGLLYLFFENVFNFIECDLLSKKPIADKLQLRPSNPASLWHIFTGAISGLLLYLLFLIPFKMTNIFHIILSGILGSIIITSIELGFGYLLFYVLKIKKFWDYSNSKINIVNKEIKLNFLGLIDIWHSLAWILITYLFYFINHLFKSI